ncbi:hypothetical protein MTR67_013924 [Solanum verrucosum]|uniref:Alkyl transferase n=1 Tax=Solanum verrucosum TaxID=315347 RepID=A0AAF0QIH9_SOLVR|nr:hypothetical protein MTR67_013924 [Solanum verrucosum]
MDGNRRYSKKQNLIDGNGHRAGFSALINMLKYCYELGVKYITVYAFSIDNFKRRPEEVVSLMSVCPDPDIIIRTSGAARLSNFLLWQSAHCLLYSPAALWPEIGLRHLIWVILDFQRNHLYLKEKKKQS